MSLLRNRFIRIGLLAFVLLFVAYTALGFWLARSSWDSSACC